MKRILTLLFLSAVFGCGSGGGSAETTTPFSLSLVKKITLTTDTEGGSARPEVVATADRIFVLYLGHIGDANSRTFDVKIYDGDLNTTITSTTIVPPSADYGNATDIRISSDGTHLYAFYETTTTNTTYLHGAKYALNDTFDLAAQAAEPIASGKPVFQLVEGDEILNDPAPLVGPDSVFVITRIMSSMSTTGKTIYRVREFNKNDLTPRSLPFDLDLSSAADGRARVASLLYWNNSIYMALATTVSDVGLYEKSDDGAPCDIILVKMKPDWTFDPQTDVRTISAEADDRENYITGLRADGEYFYVTYKQSVGSPPTGEHRAVIKIFDAGWNQLLKEVVKTASWGGTGAGEIRPSLEVNGNRIYSGQSDSYGLGSGNAEIYVYDMN